MIAVAQQRHPTLSFRIGDAESLASSERIEGKFDYIILSDLIGALDDCETTLRQLHRLCTRDNALVVAYYSPLWARCFAWASGSPQDARRAADFPVAAGHLEPVRSGRVRADQARLAQIVPRGCSARACDQSHVGTLPGSARGAAQLSGGALAGPRGDHRRARSPSSSRAATERGNIDAASAAAGDGGKEWRSSSSRPQRRRTLAEIHRVAAAHPEARHQSAVQEASARPTPVQGFDQASGEV